MEKLKEFREKAGFTQEELAKKAGISRVTISMLETGAQKNITVNTLVKIAVALNRRVADFFQAYRKVN